MTKAIDLEIANVWAAYCKARDRAAESYIKGDDDTSLNDRAIALFKNYDTLVESRQTVSVVVLHYPVREYGTDIAIGKMSAIEATHFGNIAMCVVRRRGIPVLRGALFGYAGKQIYVDGDEILEPFVLPPDNVVPRKR